MHHEHDHTHDHNCTHEHDYSHDHGHIHDHCPDAECGLECCDHHHSRAVALINDALVVSKRGTVQFESLLSAEDALSDVTKRMLSIAQLMEVDGFIAGHIKALFDCSAGRATISITRLDTVDIERHKNWKESQQIASCELSSNFLTVKHTDVPVSQLLDEVLYK
jgi:hypothetical protein